MGSCASVAEAQGPAASTEVSPPFAASVPSAQGPAAASELSSSPATSCASTPRSNSHEESGPKKLFTDGESLNDKLVGVVVTIFEGSSYDAMFREVRPTTVAGERVSTYSIGNCDVAEMLTHLFSSARAPEAWRSLVDDIRRVPADAVVFNFECCSGCGDHAFPGDPEHTHGRRRCCQRHRGPSTEHVPGVASPTMAFIGFAMHGGYTVMCSDFSLKSLIYEWSEEHLGPNPFVKLGQCNQQFCLEFDLADLQNDEVPQQLQVLGELCADQGKAVVAAQRGTIVDTVDPNRQRTELYDVKVLTVVTDHASVDSGRWTDDMKCRVGCGGKQKIGTAGHVALTYSSCGQLIASNGHWIELIRIDTTVEAVRRVAARNFGDSEVDDFDRELGGLASESDRVASTQLSAKKLVQQSVASRMKSRSKFSS